MLGPFTAMILGAAALSPGDRVLDVGCGCGAITLDAARAVAPGRSVGIDLSGPMLARARENARRADVGNASFERGDAQIYPFRPVFDAVISRFGVMFFADPVGAFANLRKATRRGGRLAFVCWQPLLASEWLIVPGAALAEHPPLPDLQQPGAPGMFALAEPGRIREILAGSGWNGITVTSKHAPVQVGGTIDEAVAFLRTGPMGRRVSSPAPTAGRRLAPSFQYEMHLPDMRAGTGCTLMPPSGSSGQRRKSCIWRLAGARGQCRDLVPAQRSRRALNQAPGRAQAARRWLAGHASPAGPLMPAATGSPASRHSGIPPASRQARRPLARSSRTASWANTQYGPRQYATTSVSGGSSASRWLSWPAGIEAAPGMCPAAYSASGRTSRTVT